MKCNLKEKVSCLWPGVLGVHEHFVCPQHKPCVWKTQWMFGNWINRCSALPRTCFQSLQLFYSVIGGNSKENIKYTKSTLNHRFFS